MITVLTMLATLLLSDEDKALSSATSCYKSYIEILNKAVSDDMDSVTVRVLEKTSLIAFNRGSICDVGTFSESYQQYFSCTTSNATGRTLSITETQQMPIVLEEVPWLSEFSDNYVDNDEKFFYIYLFNFNAGAFTYEAKKKYNNTQLYEHIISRASKQ